MNITPHEWQNAQKALTERRQKVAARGSASSKGRPPLPVHNVANVANEFFRQAQPLENTDLRPAAPSNPTQLTADEIRQARRHFNLASLDDLGTGHMAPAAAAIYCQMLADVIRWRQEQQSQAFIICSDGPGIGKTHVARAIRDSYCTVFWTGERPLLQENGEATITLERRGLLLTARAVMNLVGDGGDWQERLLARRPAIIVLDDVGREGLLKFVKQDLDNKTQLLEKQNKTQLLEKQDRYYEFINFLYEHKIRLLITSNLLLNRLWEFFNHATCSRLDEMAPVGCIYELTGIPDYRRLKSGRP